MAHFAEIDQPKRFLSGRDIVCFSHDWTGDPLSKTHLMRLLARENRVLWVNSIGYRTPTASKSDVRRAARKLTAALMPIRQVEPNIFVLNPLVIPAYGTIARTANRRILSLQVIWAMKRLGFRRPINWIFNPAAAVVARAIGEELLIYHCVDEHSAISGVNSESMLDTEKRLLTLAHLVIVSADRLYRNKAPLNSQTILVRHGVDYSHFRKALANETQVPTELKNLPRPIIGYFGLMSRDWIDLDLLLGAARHFSSGSLVMLGKTAMDLSPLKAMPNVHLLGRKPYEELPAYCKGFDVAIIPFPISEVTLNSNPLKAREYLAAGLPVVSTDVPEVRVLPECRIGHNLAGFIAEIESALIDPGPKPWRSALMNEESWEARLSAIDYELSQLASAPASHERQQCAHEGP